MIRQKRTFGKVAKDWLVFLAILFAMVLFGGIVGVAITVARLWRKSIDRINGAIDDYIWSPLVKTLTWLNQFGWSPSRIQRDWM